MELAKEHNRDDLLLSGKNETDLNYNSDELPCEEEEFEEKGSQTSVMRLVVGTIFIFSLIMLIGFLVENMGSSEDGSSGGIYRFSRFLGGSDGTKEVKNKNFFMKLWGYFITGLLSPGLALQWFITKLKSYVKSDKKKLSA